MVFNKHERKRMSRINAFAIMVGISLGLTLMCMGVVGNFPTIEAYTIEEIPGPPEGTFVATLEVPVYPVLTFGQEVTLNNEFFQDVKAVVVSRIRDGLYVVAPMEGPVTNQRIDSRITLEREE